MEYKNKQDILRDLELFIKEMKIKAGVISIYLNKKSCPICGISFTKVVNLLEAIEKELEK